MISKSPKGNRKVDSDALVELHKQTAGVIAKALKEELVDVKVLELAIKFLDNNGISAIPTIQDPNELGEVARKEVKDELSKLVAQFEHEDNLVEFANVG